MAVSGVPYDAAIRVFDMLLDAGANVNVEDSSGDSPVLEMSAGRDKKLVSDEKTAELTEKLVAKGADVHHRNQSDYTALHWAVEMRNRL